MLAVGQAFDYSDYDTRTKKLIIPVANHILSLATVRSGSGYGDHHY